MRHSIPLLILTLATAANPLGAQEDPIRIAPLDSGQNRASAGSMALNLLSAQSAQEFGVPGTAVLFYREALRQAPNASESRRLIMALTTVLLDNGELLEAENTLLSPLALPHDSAWNLRAGLVQVQKRDLPRAGGHLDAIKREELAPEDLGWWYLLQGRIADAADDSPRAQGFYDQAVAAADKISAAQRIRFQIYRDTVFLRTGTVTEAFIEQLRLQALQWRGTELGIQSTILHAHALNEFGRRPAAINVLKDQLTGLLPAQRSARDRTLLQLGLIATTKTDVGREALLQLLTDGADPDRMREALLLLGNEPQATDFRRRLDVLIARPEPHPIMEDLLLKRAQLAAAEKTAAGYTRADKDVEDLKRRFPGSVLRAPALALQASMEWAQKRYLGAADYAAQAARAAGADPAARARLGLLEAEALFRGHEYSRAAVAYEAVLRNRPKDVEVSAGDLNFQRLQAEIEATDFSDATASSRAVGVLDRLETDPEFDGTNRWEGEWNLARKLRVSGQTDVAYKRVNNLLGTQGGVALPSPDLRAQMSWLQAQLSLEADQPETTLRLTAALVGPLPNVTPGLADEIRSTSVLLKGRAEIALGQENKAIETFAGLQQRYKASPAAAQSVLILAEYYKSKDRIDEAQKLYRRMPDDFPGSPYVPQALYNAALLDVAKGQNNEAAIRFDQLARDYPQSPLVFGARLQQADLLLLDSKSFGLASQIYLSLTVNFPNHPRVYEAVMGLADCYNAMATADANSAERAVGAYERLVEVQDVPIDLRVAAGYKLGLIHYQRGQLDKVQLEKAQQVWWGGVVTAFLLDPKMAAKLGANGRDWMGKTLNSLAKLYAEQNRTDEAHRAREILVQTGLLGKEAAAKSLTPP